MAITTRRNRRIALGAVVLFVLFLAGACWAERVDEYEAAVTRNMITGSVSDPYQQGFYVVPFVSWQTYPIRKQQVPEGESADRVEVLTADQLRLVVEASYWWRVEPDMVRSLYLNIGGPAQVHNFVYDAYRNATRDAVAELAAEDLLSEDRQGVGARIGEILKSKLSGTGVVVTQYFLRDIDPPQKVKTAIEEKLSRQQDVATEEYQTQIVQEKARQRIEEAKGIRDAQNLVAQSLQGDLGLRYLNWRYFEVLQKMAEGENNLVIANEEMPLIVNPGQQ